MSSRRDQLEEKSAGARNDYLLCLAATNAHQNRYFVVDLQLCMSSMEQTVYEKVGSEITNFCYLWKICASLGKVDIIIVIYNPNLKILKTVFDIELLQYWLFNFI